jgi:hypothetical protein
MVKTKVANVPVNERTMLSVVFNDIRGLGRNDNVVLRIFHASEQHEFNNLPYSIFTYYITGPPLLVHFAASTTTKVLWYYCRTGIFGSKLELSKQFLHFFPFDSKMLNQFCFVYSKQAARPYLGHTHAPGKPKAKNSMCRIKNLLVP